MGRYEIKDGEMFIKLQEVSELNKILEILMPPVSTVPMRPSRVIFNDPATIAFWPDGTKTVVKCGEDDAYDKEKGLALCYMKKVFRNKGNYNEVLKKWCVEDNNKEDKPRWIKTGDFLKCSKCGFDALFHVKKCPKCESIMDLSNLMLDED